MAENEETSSGSPNGECADFWRERGLREEAFADDILRDRIRRDPRAHQCEQESASLKLLKETIRMQSQHAGICWPVAWHSPRKMFAIGALPLKDGWPQIVSFIHELPEARKLSAANFNSKFCLPRR